jgi:hypothetical protein
MLERLAKDAQYKDGVPRSWMGGPLDSGAAEVALIEYVAALEVFVTRVLQKKAPKSKAKKPEGRFNQPGEVGFAGMVTYHCAIHGDVIACACKPL